MSGSKLTRRRAHLMEQDPHCYWCHCEVVYFLQKGGGKMPDNFATLDHLNDRILGGPRPVRGQIVLACLRCNNERAAIAVNALPIAVRRDQARRWARLGSILPDAVQRQLAERFLS